MPKKKESAIESFVDAAHAKISEWTTNELRTIQEFSISPVCIKINDNRYRVSNFDIDKAGSYWVASSHLFNDLRSAVVYCSLLHLSRFAAADEVLHLNNQIRDLSFDKDLFQERVNTAHQASNQFNIDLFTSRHKEVKEKLSFSKQLLNNILTTQLRRISK